MKLFLFIQILIVSCGAAEPTAEQRFAAAVKAGDEAAARALIAAGKDDAAERITTDAAITAVLGGDWQKCAALLLDLVKEAPETGAETVATFPKLDAAQVAWLETNRLLSPEAGRQLLASAVEHANAPALEAFFKTAAGFGLTREARAEALHHAVDARDLKIIDLLLANGARPDLKGEDGFTAADLAAQTLFMAALPKLDRDGKYKAMLAQFTRDFSTTAASPLCGTWTYSEDAPSWNVLKLEPDATGRFPDGDEGYTFWWKEIAKDEIALTRVVNGKPSKDKPLVLRHDAAADRLSVEIKGEKTVFSRWKEAKAE